MKLTFCENIISRCFYLVLLLFTLSNVRAQNITTVLGGNNRDGKPATSSGLIYVTGLVVDANDNIYILEPTSVRKVSAGSGIITTVAGNENGSLADSVPATTALLGSLSCLSIDAKGNLYIGEDGRIRKIDAATGIIKTVVGTGFAGYGFGGDSGLAVQAKMKRANSIAFDPSGNMFFCDGNRVRKVTAATGIITTIAGKDSAAYSGDGGLATNALLSAPQSITCDSSGNLYVADKNNNVIRKIAAATGIITTIAGTGVAGMTGDGGPATAAQLNFSSVASDNAISASADGNIYIAGFTRIRKVDATTGIINTIAGSSSAGYTGDGSAAPQATFYDIRYITISQTNNIYISDHNNHVIRKIARTSSIVNTICGSGDLGYGGFGKPVSEAQIYTPENIAVDHSGNIYLSDINNRKIYRASLSSDSFSVIFSGNNNISMPTGLAVDNNGNLYFADNAGTGVKKWSAATQTITIVAGTGNYSGYSGDGGPATSAKLNNALGIAIDSIGNIYIADKGNNRIRMVSVLTGIITTVAGTGIGGYGGDGDLATKAQLYGPSGVAVDQKGNLYIVDYNNNRVRRVDAKTRIITTYAGTGPTGYGYNGDGGPANAANLFLPFAVATDNFCNVYISDQNNSRIRKVDVNTGIISTVAGSGNLFYIYNGDNVPAINANLNHPAGVAIAEGNLYIADKSFNRIRKVTIAATAYFAAFYDDNSNGVKDSTETWAQGTGVSFLKVGSEKTITTGNGWSKTYLDTGNYTLKLVSIPNYTASPSLKNLSFLSPGTSDSVLFAIQPIAGKTDLQVNLLPVTPARPGSAIGYQLIYKNAGTAVINNAKISFVKSFKTTINSTIPAFIGNKTDTLTWQLNALRPRDSGIITIDATVARPPFVNPGDYIFPVAFVSAISGDVSPENDTSQLRQLITGSYDPNDKNEAHGTVITPGQVSKGEYLSYLIRFQNTGNDTATNVLVRDTLDTQLDWNSFEMITSSHNYQLTISGQNKLAWTFNNILLPDSSSNEKLSHGYIAYRIRPKTTLQERNRINNAGSIYFDYNLPVATNNVQTLVKSLPALPPTPLMGASQYYCRNAGIQKIKMLNLPPTASGATSNVWFNNNVLLVAADSSFSFDLQQLSAGSYPVLAEYVNENGSKFITQTISIIEPSTPDVDITASSTQVTTTVTITLTASNKSGGGNNPLYAFAKDRSFSNLIQAEATLNNISILSDDLAAGDNWIYVRMKTSEPCYTSLTAMDSIRITKTGTVTVIIDPDNPGVVISGIPNPFKDVLIIRGFSFIKSYEANIYDATGRLLQTAIINRCTTLNINTVTWKKGPYWISVSDLKRKKLIGTMQVIKQ